ncbi:uncharacterized protein LOC131875154 [Cryptomeria japonica]|uniref:uncharacterized protein LOC131875154 n=1 Tax=Cryptomeria japonica TaxID=3369 RepID=UPI0027DA4AAD|nr:uncharacterized protein LOC131875154 [Cryptomeria japonica]
MGGNDGNWNNTNSGNYIGGNGYGSHQNNGHNRGNNDNYGNGNGGDRNKNNGSGGNNENNDNNNGGGNSGNNVNYGNNGGFNRGKDAGEWYRNLPDRCIDNWDEFVTLFFEEFGDHNDPSLTSHELTCIKNNQNESVAEFNKRFNKKNRKVSGKLAKRDDPKLYNTRIPKKDYLTQIMDMLKDIKGKQNLNEKPPYRNNKQMNFKRPRLHDMPYNTNWKDGKLVKPNPSKETPDPLKRENKFVGDFLWCEVCNLPHDENKCMIAQGLAEDWHQEEECEPTTNVLSLDTMWGRDED